MQLRAFLFIMRLTACCALGFGTASLAAGGGFQEASAQRAAGGFSGPGASVSTVAQTAAMSDDTPVTVRGHIIRHLGKDKYLFKDATGEITVEIDDDEWGGQTITPDDLVELQGEIDKEWRRVEIDVDRVLPLKQGKP